MVYKIHIERKRHNSQSNTFKVAQGLLAKINANKNFATYEFWQNCKMFGFDREGLCQSTYLFVNKMLDQTKWSKASIYRLLAKCIEKKLINKWGEKLQIVSYDNAWKILGIQSNTDVTYRTVVNAHVTKKTRTGDFQIFKIKIEGLKDLKQTIAKYEIERNKNRQLLKQNWLLKQRPASTISTSMNCSASNLEGEVSRSFFGGLNFQKLIELNLVSQGKIDRLMVQYGTFIKPQPLQQQNDISDDEYIGTLDPSIWERFSAWNKLDRFQQLDESELDFNQRIEKLKITSGFYDRCKRQKQSWIDNENEKLKKQYEQQVVEVKNQIEVMIKDLLYAELHNNEMLIDLQKQQYETTRSVPVPEISVNRNEIEFIDDDEIYQSHSVSTSTDLSCHTLAKILGYKHASSAFYQQNKLSQTGLYQIVREINWFQGDDLTGLNKTRIRGRRNNDGHLQYGYVQVNKMIKI